MFHQADDIQLFLSPIEPSQVLAANELAAAGPVSPHDLLTLIKSDLTIRTKESRQTFDFLVKNNLCDGIEMGLPTLEDRLSSPTDAHVVNLDAAYDLGAQAFKNGQIADAIYVFAVLASHPMSRAPALSALAACACFQADYAIALLFAQESIASKETHPRVYLIAGYSALKSGEKKTAKRNLALATRLARGDVRYRDEQRCAQRELLLMQLAS